MVGWTIYRGLARQIGLEDWYLRQVGRLLRNTVCNAELPRYPIMRERNLRRPCIPLPAMAYLPELAEGRSRPNRSTSHHARRRI